MLGVLRIGCKISRTTDLLRIGSLHLIEGADCRDSVSTDMEALSADNELGSEVSATINLGAEEHEAITLRCTKEGLLSATLVDLKEKCMQILGAHLQRHSVPLEEPDLDVLDETYEEDEDTKEEAVEGAAPPKKKKKVNKK